MGVRILHDDENEQATFYCSTTEWAFGPVIGEEENHDARERAEAFLEWMDNTGKKDPRKYNDKELESIYSDWRSQEADQWKEKESDDD